MDIHLFFFAVAAVLVHSACNNGWSGTLTYQTGPGSPLLILSDADGAGPTVKYKSYVDCTWDYQCPVGFYAAVLVVGEVAGVDYVALMYSDNTVVQKFTSTYGFYPGSAVSSGNGADPVTLVFPTNLGRLRFYSGTQTYFYSFGFNATFTCRLAQCSRYNESSPLMITQLPWTLSSDADGDGSAIPSAAGEACEWRFNSSDSPTLNIGVAFGFLAASDTLALYNGSSTVPLIKFSSSSIWSIPIVANDTSISLRYSTGTDLATTNNGQ